MRLVLLRSIWTHLHVCWDRTPGTYTRFCAIASGIIVPGALLGVAVPITGFSYRIGQTCILNYESALAVNWAWLLAFAGLAFVLQLVTTGFCLWIYFRSLRVDDATISSRGRSALDRHSWPGQMGASTLSRQSDRASQTWMKVHRLFIVQWRPIAICMVLIVDVVYLTVIFWAQDHKFGHVTSTSRNSQAVERWTTCLASTAGNKNQCLEYSKAMVVDKSKLLAAYVLVAVSGLSPILPIKLS